MPPKNLLDADRIRDGLKTRRIGKKVIVLATISSTNDIAAEYLSDSRNDGLVILAEEQISGRGRGGNKWYGGKGQSVLCSIVLTDESSNAELLSLTAAVAVAEAIGETARIKWPNDIILNGRKVAGILLESKQTEYGRAYILGIGINCHQKDFPDELNSAATSIDRETGKTYDRILLTKRLLSSIEYWIHSSHTKPEKVVNEWKRLSLLLGQRITVTHDGREFSGNCVGIDPNAGLILQLDSGTLGFFPANQTTIGKQAF